MNRFLDHFTFSEFKKDGRLIAIDLIKLFASLLVIFSHCMMKFIDDGTSNPIFNFIWLTQMPLFMVSSGFVNHNFKKGSTIGKYFKKIGKNALLLLVPCFSFMIIMCLIKQISVAESINMFFLNPETNLWFLWALFIIHVVFDFGIFLSNKINNKISFLLPSLFALLFSFAIAISIVLFNGRFNFDILSIKLICYYIPFYCFGNLFFFFIRKIDSNQKKWKIILLIVTALSFLILTFECFYFKSIIGFEDTNIFHLFLRVIGSLASVLVCFFVSNIVVLYKPFFVIAKYGSFSLQTYYLHIIVLRTFSFPDVAPIYQWSFAYGIGLLLIIFVIFSMLIIYNIPFLHLLLFGKSFSRYGFEKRLIGVLRRDC